MRKQIMESRCPGCERAVEVDLEMPTTDSRQYAFYLNHVEPKWDKFEEQEQNHYFAVEILRRGHWIAH